MEDKSKITAIVKKAQEDYSSGKITRRDFNSIMMTFGAVAGYTLFNSFANAWTGTRMRKSSAVTYQITRSLRFRASASAYLTRTPSSAGNQRTWTWSGWIKRGALGQQNILQVGANPGGTILYFGSDDSLHLTLYISAAETFITSQFFRDPSSWYHLVLSVDTTQATSSNRVKIYVNGSQITAFSLSNQPAQNATTTINSTTAHTFGLSTAALSGYLDGYLAGVDFIDGLGLTASSFGEINATTGVWNPKKYSGSYGTNGYYLDFKDPTSTTTVCYDRSGNSNHFTPNNLSVTSGITYDSMIDVPLIGAGSELGNYCVFNQLCHGSQMTISEGNLKAIGGSNSENAVLATIGMTSGLKFYAEFTAVNTTNTYLGIALETQLLGPGGGSTAYIGDATGSYGLNPGGSITYNAGVLASVATYTNGNIIGIAYDGVAGTLQFYINNTAVSYTVTGIDTSKTWFFATSSYTSTEGFVANFGQRAFTYTPPTGFKALHTGNLATPAIIKPNLYFDVATYTGTAATKTISTDGNGNNLVIAPDLVWAKSRSAGANSHVLFDSVRGVGNYLMSSATSAEFNNAGMLTSFNSNGFSVGADSTTAINGSGLSLVSWMWKAGGAAVSNTSGTVTSQVSANTTSGFSIVTYTGTLSANGTFTVGHGLGSAPSMIITKSRNATSDWIVMHKSLPNWNYAVFLELVQGYTDQTTYGARSTPTSSVFTANYTTGLGINGHTHVAYCFSEVTGFSKFGKYTGNSSTDGTFVYCGFRPKYIMVKWSNGSISSSSNAYWVVLDTTRDSYNANPTHALFPHTSGSEDASYYEFDILSNGFKTRLASSDRSNYSGGTYIFAAFAEAPLKYANAR